MSIRTEVQQSETSEIIELFSLDLTKFGDSVYYFIAGSSSSGDVVWKGNTYVPFDVQASGFELDGKGSAPTPKISFSLTNNVITVFIAAYDDLIGAKLTRTKTYKKYLDGEPTANPNAHFPLDIYRIERKTRENRLEVEFELSSIMDQQGRQLPGRTVTSSYCPWIYRIFNGTTFDYNPSDKACPYVGTSYFNTNNESVGSASEDKCSKTVEGCKARFGDDAVLPHGGFTGASRSLL